MHDSQPSKTGRPSDYTPELAALICERIADGESLRKICQDDDMPAKGTVMRWLDKNKDFQDQYARAHELQTEVLREEALEIADDADGDTMITEKGFVGNPTAVSRAKLKVETRLKLMALMHPKKYGKKLALDVNDTRTPRQLTDAELAEIAAGDE